MKRAKRSLGQNFLIDQNILNKIVNFLEIKDQNVLEIGPGRGALTKKIIEKKPKSLILIEKDIQLFEKLKEEFKNIRFVKMYNSDILKIKLEKILKKKTIIFGNLPYNISSQILVNLIKFNKWPPDYSDLILMFQKEVADKIIGKSYGRLSIISKFRLKLENKFEVSPNCFIPKPKVKSSLIHLKPLEQNEFKIKNLKSLEIITHSFFSNKRKMIKKNLIKILDKKKFKIFKGLDLNKRPSDYEPSFYYKVTELFEKE